MVDGMRTPYPVGPESLLSWMLRKNTAMTSASTNTCLPEKTRCAGSTLRKPALTQDPPNCALCSWRQLEVVQSPSQKVPFDIVVTGLQRHLVRVSSLVPAPQSSKELCSSTRVVGIVG